MHAAWHFWYAVSFGGEGGLQKVGLGGTHPLTQRYGAGQKSAKGVYERESKSSLELAEKSFGVGEYRVPNCRWLSGNNPWW
ncbi:hypothetical protein CRN61_08985 [Vibrio vulnificus]|nr:hypothetical protein CRN54_07415 [Vibrio vulnificus]POC79725.1 hypothetical protein CRN61_08985 [Vibrio vulnificus]